MTIRILHAHSTFSLGGKEARAVRLMNAFGGAASHTILSATDQLGAREAIAAGVAVSFPGDAPSLVGKPGLARYRRLAAYMRGFDLVLTYNWGAMDVVAARRLFGGPPLIHHEDGFNEDEAVRRKPIRNCFRQLFLAAAYRLVVPSQVLEQIARTEWRQPADRLERIPNGIPVDRFQAPPEPDAIPGLHREPGELVVGTVAGLRKVKNLPRLLRVFQRAQPPELPAWLVIVGEGPERAAIEVEAVIECIEGSLLLPGFLPDPARWIGHFDVFALSSDSEQFPISLIEAMAAGLPCVSTDVGDVRNMVSEDNRFAIGDEAAMIAALNRFLTDPDLRRRVGAANRRKAERDFDERTMIARYAALYGAAIGRPEAFVPPAV
jgi:glycosyltransferase involved in cell wall biosynthesis